MFNRSSGNGQDNNSHAGSAYLITAPKIIVGEESVCLVLFDEPSLRSSDAKIRVQLKATSDDRILYETEERLSSCKL